MVLKCEYNKSTILDLLSNFLINFPQYPIIFKWTNLLSVDLSYNELQGSLPIIPLKPHSTTSHAIASLDKSCFCCVI